MFLNLFSIKLKVIYSGNEEETNMQKDLMDEKSGEKKYNSTLVWLCKIGNSIQTFFKISF